MATIEDTIPGFVSGPANAPYDEFAGCLETSPADKAQYRLLRLPNNLIAICISDPAATNAAAALSIGVGGFGDPQSMPGLAHLLEHMLFMGSVEYPDENGFSQYISKNGGKRNAYTSRTCTCYYFDLVNSALAGGLHRLADFLAQPLLRVDTVGREVNAVDSEFRSMQSDEARRRLALSSWLSDRSHPKSRFYAGNRDTLATDNPGLLAAELRRFFDRYYSADIMRLVVYGNYSLDALATMALPFANIPGKGITRPTISGHPLGAEQLSQTVFYEGLGDKTELCMEFAVEDPSPLYRKGVSLYVSRLLMHQEEGSLSGYLRKLDLATAVGASLGDSFLDGYGIYTIRMYTTPKGAQRTAEIAGYVFAYLQMIARQGPQQWFYQELREIHQLDFDHSESARPEVLVRDLAASAQNKYIVPEHMVSRDKLLDPFDPQPIAAFMEVLQQPANCRLLVMERRGAASMAYTEEEPYFGVRYATTECLLKGSCDEAPFRLPNRNPFVPRSLNLVLPARQQANMQSPAPTLLRNTDSLELWHWADDRFFLPRGAITAKIQSPASNESPTARAMLDIASAFWMFTCAETLSSARLAGLDFSIVTLATGVKVEVSGFSSRLPYLVERLVGIIRHAQIDNRMFLMCKERIAVMYSTKSLERTYLQAIEWEKVTSLVPRWHHSELLQAIKAVSLAQFRLFLGDLFARARVQVLVAGNFAEEDAMDCASALARELSTEPLPVDQLKQPLEVQYSPGHYILQRTLPSDRSVEGAFACRLWMGELSDLRMRCISHLLDALIAEPFFNQMRTIEQLGYACFGWRIDYNTYGQYLSLVIQGGEHSPVYLSLRVSQFLTGFRQQLADLSEEALQRRVAALVKKRQMKIETVKDVAKYMWRNISGGSYEFESAEREIVCLQKLSRAELVDMWDKYVSPESSSRMRIDVQMWPAGAHLPTADEQVRHQPEILALRDMLERAGAQVNSLDDLRDLVLAVHKEAAGHESAAGRLTAKLLDKHGAEAVAENRKQYVETAAQMALDVAGNLHTRTAHTANARSGMHQVAQGAWIIDNIPLAQSTHTLHDCSEPLRQLVPKL
ncbi:metalloprotease [Coemansia sp. RSA 552]|nr:metalloprotease [Coemansia sp. RSA 552]